MRKLLAAIAQIQMELSRTLAGIPAWKQVVDVSRRICSPVVGLARGTLRVLPVLKRLEWLLEIETLTRRHPVMLALSLAYVAWRGLMTTPLGHIGTDRVIYPLIGALGGFNPFLGMISGVVYGVADLAQKLLIPDMYGARGWGDANYWGGMAGYVVAYSSLMLMGLVPGMLSRVFRQIVRVVFRRRQAAHADGWDESTQSFAGPAESSLAELVAAMAGGLAGGWAVMHEVAPITERPAFMWRPNPDVSCHHLEVNTHLIGRAPVGGSGAAIGAAAPVLTPPPIPDEFEWTAPNGVTYVVRKNEQGQYINILTGGEVDVTNLDKWKQTWSDNIRDQQAWSAEQRAQQEARQGWFDKQMDQMVADQHARDQVSRNLSTMEKGILFGSLPPDLLTHIRDMQSQLSEGKMPDRDHLNQLYKTYRDQKEGNVISWDQMPTQSQLNRDIFTNTVKDSVGELVTGTKSDGTTSWIGMLGRGLIGVATGGGSEMVFVPANALNTMKTYVDEGGNSVLGGFGAAVVTVVKDELTGRAVGGVIGGGIRVGSKVGEVAADAIAAAAKNGNSAAKTLINIAQGAKNVGSWIGKVAETPVSRKPPNLGTGVKPSGVPVLDGGKIVRGVNRAGSTNLTYKPAGIPPDQVANGISSAAVKQTKMVAGKYGVVIDVRPTNPLSGPLIQSGKAIPKPGFIKSKTLTDMDALLGAKGQPGTVGFYKPKLPPQGSMSAEEYAKLKNLFNNRNQEFKDNFRKMYEAKQAGKITVKDGTVYDKATGKPFAGDNDIFEIRDPVTGRPLPRYQVDHHGNVLMDAKTGQPKLNPVREAIIKDLQKPPFNNQHGAHMDWKYDNASKTPPPRSPAGARSPAEISEVVDKNVINKHSASNPSNEPLISYGPDGAVGTTVVEGGR